MVTIDQNNSWFNLKKQEVVVFSLFLKQIRDKVSMLLLTNSWILEDFVLCESYSNLVDMDRDNEKNLTEFISTIQKLENDSDIFYSSDIDDELTLIKENIQSESIYVNNIIVYIANINNYRLNDTQFDENCDNFYEWDKKCLELVKSNSKTLKKIKDERRDLS